MMMLSSWSNFLSRRLYSRRVQPRDWHLAGHAPPTSLLFADTDTAPSADLSEHEHDPPPPPTKRPAVRPTPEQWRRHRESIRQSFPDGWNPTRKLSRDAMDGLRSLHAFDSSTFSCAVLADKFQISPEAVRRILRSRWEPSREKRAHLAERERRSREVWIARKRQEEKDTAARILSQAGQNGELPSRQTSRVRSNDRFFFD